MWITCLTWEMIGSIKVRDAQVGLRISPGKPKSSAHMFQYMSVRRIFVSENCICSLDMKCRANRQCFSHCIILHPNSWPVKLSSMNTRIQMNKCHAMHADLWHWWMFCTRTESGFSAQLRMTPCSCSSILSLWQMLTASTNQTWYALLVSHHDSTPAKPVLGDNWSSCSAQINDFKDL